jgi:hypothetical protein
VNPNTQGSELLTPAWVFAHLTLVMIALGGWLMTKPEYQTLGTIILTLAGGGNVGGNVMAKRAGVDQARKENMTPEPQPRPNVTPDSRLGP